MAAMSLRLTAMAFQPRSLRVVSDRSASRPAMTVSVASSSRAARARLQDGGVVAEPDLTCGRHRQEPAQAGQRLVLSPPGALVGITSHRWRPTLLARPDAVPPPAALPLGPQT